MPLPDDIEVKSDATLILFEREEQQGNHCTFSGPQKLTLKNSCPKTIRSIQITCDESPRGAGTKKESPARMPGPKGEHDR
ncbi:hypothetical protein D187_005556 [Cystobacter fuscus DSM 2262]|uniref:Uncharacterized protein n=1 Tax=Cystobacter fuscus (strain ATCC 25194 / DSM 2262 / NBRC 100088 / M29) TaxID=1242864 RepID=S9PPL6_CYSF2|nr:hypothetical protein [Cystobacter fuscus]EPX64422.1 hypothetical protein D187_005556 [Cystobacter fuscus DSM 2262]